MPKKPDAHERDEVLEVEVVLEEGLSGLSDFPPQSMPRTGTASGTVKQWSEDEGWGVIASDEVPGELWVHHVHIEGDGYRTLAVGEAVEFECIQMPAPGEQDGYS
jgi:cold shock CspA family protein